MLQLHAGACFMFIAHRHCSYFLLSCLLLILTNYVKFLDNQFIYAETWC